MCGIYVSESRTESKNTQRDIFFYVRGVGLCLRWYGILRTLSKPFMYSNCPVTLSRLSLHYVSSVCFPLIPSFLERFGFWGHEHLDFGCLRFPSRLAFLFSPG